MKTIDKQKQGKLNNNQLHPMVRSMLLLGFLWKNCCHHLFETKNLLDVRFRGLSHTCRTLSRTSRSAEEREGDQTSCVYPHYGAHVQQLAQGILFYGNAFVHVARLRIPPPTSRQQLLRGYGLRKAQHGVSATWGIVLPTRVNATAWLHPSKRMRKDKSR